MPNAAQTAMKPRGVSRRRLSPQARRAQLLQTAIDVFAQMGIERAGHGDIAKRAGVSTATVFNYFPTRDALVNAVLAEIELIVERMFASITDLSDDPERRILQMAAAYQAMVEEQPAAVQTFLKWGVSFDPEIRPHYLDFQSRILDRLVGFLPESADPRTEARILYGAANMLATMAFDGADMEILSQYAKRIAQTLARPTLARPEG